MEMNSSSKLVHVVMLLLLLPVLFPQTESASPSSHEQLSITGRRMMTYHKLNDAIDTPPSRSRRGPGGHGRKLVSIYQPNGDIYTSPSSSGHGGGRIHHYSSP